VTNELADRMAIVNTTVGTFVHLRQRALRAMFDRAGHMVRPAARWAELTRLNSLWDGAWADHRELDAKILHARALAVVGRESVVTLTARRDELRAWMTHCEAAFEAELVGILGSPSWPVARKVLETA
jgi:hypothetical protein